MQTGGMGGGSLAPLGAALRLPTRVAPEGARAGSSPPSERIRAYALDCTITEMALASGVARPYLSQIETGRRLPRDEEVEGISSAYGLPLQEWYPQEV